MDNFNPFSITGNNFLITGAASGIGKATSILLSKQGARLILVDQNYEGLIHTQSECISYTKILVLDLIQISSLRERINEVIIDFGKLNGLVHLAGKAYISPLKTVTEERCNQVFTINTFSAIELSKIFSSKNNYAGDKGSIVLISSVYGLVGSRANVGYAMTKSALHGITKSLAIELAPKAIRVNCIAPGFVKTKMLDKSMDLFNSEYLENLRELHPLGLGEADDIANAILFLLSDGAKWITGSIFSVDGGFTAQ